MGTDSFRITIPNIHLQSCVEAGANCVEVRAKLSHKLERSCVKVGAKLCQSSSEVVSKLERSCVEVRAKLFCEVRFEVET